MRLLWLATMAGGSARNVFVSSITNVLVTGVRSVQQSLSFPLTSTLNVNRKKGAVSQIALSAETATTGVGVHGGPAEVPSISTSVTVTYLVAKAAAVSFPLTATITMAKTTHRNKAVSITSTVSVMAGMSTILLESGDGSLQLESGDYLLNEAQ